MPYPTISRPFGRELLITLLRYLCLILIFILFSALAFSQTTNVVATSNVESDEHYSGLTAVGDKLYFLVHFSTDPNAGVALWKTDVNRTDATLVKFFRRITSLVSYKGALYFSANDDESGEELWRTNGTPETTTLVIDIYPGIEGSNIRGFSISNNILYFTAVDGLHGRELWKSNGTPGGTSLVKDILRVVGSSNPTLMTNVNGTLFFSANDGINGYELWRTDGTSGGTRMVKDIQPGLKSSSSPAGLTNKNGMLVFTALESATGRELWKSDGTEGGTTLLKDIRPGNQSSNASQFTVVDSTVYFAADDGVHGLELWKSNGTTTGTNLFIDLTPGPGSQSLYTIPHLSDLTSVNHRLYFLAVTPEPPPYTASQNLWVSNGTIQGTRRLTVFSEVSFSFINAHITQFKGAAYFVAGTESLDIFKTTGTVASTVPVVRDIAERFSNFVRLTKVGNYLYYIGHEKLNRTDGIDGTIVISGIVATPERDAVVESAMTISDTNKEVGVSLFPSPFISDFSLQVTGPSDKPYSVKIVDMTGAPIESSLLTHGTTYTLGSAWRPGYYLMMISSGDKVITKRVFKSE